MRINNYPHFTILEKKMKKDSDKCFEGLSNDESLVYQLEEWVRGNPMHNPIRDECCPDFSCCQGDMMEEEVRKRFANAYYNNDIETMTMILASSLEALFLNNIDEMIDINK